MIQVYYPQVAYYLLAALLAFIGIVGYMVRGNRVLVARIKKDAEDAVWDTLRSSFVSDLATNHLPHIQMCLEMIAEKLNVKLPEPPPIRYMPRRPRDAE